MYIPRSSFMISIVCPSYAHGQSFRFSESLKGKENLLRVNVKGKLTGKEYILSAMEKNKKLLHSVFSTYPLKVNDQGKLIFSCSIGLPPISLFGEQSGIVDNPQLVVELKLRNKPEIIRVPPIQLSCNYIHAIKDFIDIKEIESITGARKVENCIYYACKSKSAHNPQIEKYWISTNVLIEKGSVCLIHFLESKMKFKTGPSTG